MATTRTARKRKAASSRKTGRTLDARRDTLDFRDRMYVPTLVEVPTRIDLEQYLEYRVPILDQGREGACTGFGLAAVANYLLKSGKVVGDREQVSPRMLYTMARRYDEWPGEDYSGSSARGAMKGWQKHGVASDEIWPYSASRTRKRDPGFTDARARDARRRPLGAYLRVNHKDLVAMHSAIAEVGVLYATSSVHEGWDDVGNDGLINFSPRLTGGHAFAIVAFDERGFWIQNSWGRTWGKQGFGCISYDDWLENGSDVWVARLGAPIQLGSFDSAAIAHASGTGSQTKAYSYPDLRPHIISLGNDGAFRPGGNYGTSADDVSSLFRNDIPNALTATNSRHILLYAHGGLVGEDTAIQRLADYRAAMLDAGVYPLTFIWHTDYWSTVSNVLRDAFGHRRPEGALDAAKDFMLDRLDDALEPLSRSLTGKSVWDEMKENALKASLNAGGGARLTVRLLAKLCAGMPQLKVHVVGHSAGSIFHAPLVAALDEAGIRIASCTLWAPACTVALFKEYYAPLISRGRIERAAIFALTDEIEKEDNCANIYHKSLLYLVSNAFEQKERIPLFREGEPILGMEKFLREDATVQTLVRNKRLDLILSPNDQRVGSIKASKSKHHGDFDDDEATVKATLARVLDVGSTAGVGLKFHRSASSLRSKRMSADTASPRI
jgi:Papain family cysteine protease